jgi:hypothetical protein
MSIVALTAPLVGLLGIIMLLGGALGARFGLLTPIQGFLVAVGGMVLCALLATVLGAAGLYRTRPAAHRSGAAQAWAGLLLGVGGLTTLFLISPSRGVPAIHDITTDLDDPPRFVAIAALPAHQGGQLAYPSGANDTPAQQRRAYPEVQPILLDVPVTVALERARQAVRDLGWRLIEVPAQTGASDPQPSVREHRIEATSTSTLFRFVDDIVVRVRPEGNGSRIDARSTSRVGRSDLGANAERILAFADRLRDKP